MSAAFIGHIRAIDANALILLASVSAKRMRFGNRRGAA